MKHPSSWSSAAFAVFALANTAPSFARSVGDEYKDVPFHDYSAPMNCHGSTAAVWSRLRPRLASWMNFAEKNYAAPTIAAGASKSQQASNDDDTIWSPIVQAESRALLNDNEFRDGMVQELRKHRHLEFKYIGVIFSVYCQEASLFKPTQPIPASFKLH